MTKKFSDIISFLQKLPSEAGMSMTEMTITMALIGLGALGAASLSGNMSAGSKKLQGLVAVDSFASSLNTYLYSNLGCDDLKNAGTFSSTPQEIVLTGWKYLGMTRFEAGYDAEGAKKTATKNFEIASLQGYFENSTNPATIKDASDEDLTKSILKIRAILKIGNKPSEYVYNVPVLISSKGNIKYCSDEKNLAETCATAQGVYNATTKACDLRNSCKILDTYNQLTCYAVNHTGSSGLSCSTIFGNSKTNQYTGGFSCPPGSVANQTQSTTWVSQRDCGKKCTQDISNTMVWFTCMECIAP